MFAKKFAVPLFIIGILLFQPEAGGDGTKQNSLLNFVMAFHTTSMRAKEALRSFRRRTEASRQEREASGVTPPRAAEPSTVETDSSLTESTSGAESNSVPEVVVSGSEGEKDATNTQEEADKGQAEQEEQLAPEDTPSSSPDSDEIKESSEHESEGGEFESEEVSIQLT